MSACGPCLPHRATPWLLQVLKRNCADPNVSFEILSNPEFLAEGTAIDDLFKPDRVSVRAFGEEQGHWLARGAAR